MRLALRSPDFTTAERIETVINAEFGRPVAAMLDAGTVTVSISGGSPAHVLARLEGLTVNPESRARARLHHAQGRCQDFVYPHGFCIIHR